MAKFLCCCKETNSWRETQERKCRPCLGPKACTSTVQSAVGTEVPHSSDHVALPCALAEGRAASIHFAGARQWKGSTKKKEDAP